MVYIDGFKIFSGEGFGFYGLRANVFTLIKEYPTPTVSLIELWTRMSGTRLSDKKHFHILSDSHARETPGMQIIHNHISCDLGLFVPLD